MLSFSLTGQMLILRKASITSFSIKVHHIIIARSLSATYIIFQDVTRPLTAILGFICQVCVGRASFHETIIEIF